MATQSVATGVALKAVLVATLLPLVWKTEQEAELLVETASRFAARVVEETEEVTTNLVQTTGLVAKAGVLSLGAAFLWFMGSKLQNFWRRYSNGNTADARLVELRGTVLGPYLKSGAPVLSSGTGWAGPGHCVVLDAGSGHDVMIFHAWPSKTPGGRGDRGKGRAEDGWPVVGSGVPCCLPQSLPPLDPAAARTPGGSFMPRPPLEMGKKYLLQVSQGWDVYLGYDGKLSKSKDQVFTVRPGRLPGGTVSLEAASGAERGRFLRHRCGKLELGSSGDDDKLFANDASWMALPGLAEGADSLSLRSVNFPEGMGRNNFEMNDTYLADATWKPVAF
eukprot:s71_g30.t1